MIDSLIAHIAGQHGLIGRENLATEVLSYILCSFSHGALRDLFAEYDWPWPADTDDYHIVLQRKVSENRCIPDIQVKDDSGRARAIIESKFYARLTDYQPNGYLDELLPNGLLLFIVPERRKSEVFKALVERALKLFPRVSSDESGRPRALVETKVMEVTSWDDILDKLNDLQQRSGPNRLASDIEQLRRFCDVADKETFEPLKSDQVRESVIPGVVHQLTWITTHTITKCVETGTVQLLDSSTRQRGKNSLHADVDSSLHYGQNLRFCGVDNVWIGFWLEAWEELKESPLWIELGTTSKAMQLAKQIQHAKGDSAIIKRPNTNSWLIPIPITTGLPQEQVVEMAVRFISELRSIIEQANHH